jgi:uncharacterized protein YgiM (DUF1202 family)
MKMNHRLGRFVFLAGLFATLARGEETAVVKENNVNVRGQPSFLGETVTQLKQGEKVVVIEEISVATPKKNEPAAWAKIKMPANTPVWINTAFIDSQTKTVKSSRLNLRAGPGENHSVVGRLQRGDSVKEIRIVESWMEIETPATAYGFVAAHLLNKEPAAPAPAPVAAKPEVHEAAPTAPALQPQAPAPVAIAAPAPTVTEKNVITETPPSPVIDAAPAKVVVPVPQPQPEAVPTPPAAVVPVPLPTGKKGVTPLEIQPKPDAPTTPTAPAPKRIVRREGVVRGTVSIQAPAYYEIVGAESGKVINYLHLNEKILEYLGTNIKGFKDYVGRLVIVTGEEGIDERWPRTPVIEAETLKLVP